MACYRIVCKINRLNKFDIKDLTLKFGRVNKLIEVSNRLSYPVGYPPKIVF